MLYRSFFKRLIDILVAILVLVLSTPIMIPVLLLLSAVNHGRPFFRQTRPGKNEKPFVILKLKTMNDKKDEKGNLLSDEERLTAVGRFVRKTSLDEIPQLVNVLMGQMSLIGPRPLLMQYLDLYNQQQKRRHEVRPGITGWAQVQGRNNLPWAKRFELDVYYVDHVSFGIDLKIVALTIKNVLSAKDVSQQGQSTVTYFTGNDDE